MKKKGSRKDMDTKNQKTNFTDHQPLVTDHWMAYARNDPDKV